MPNPSFIELGAGTGNMITMFLETLQSFSLLDNMVFSIVEASQSLRDLQIRKVNDICLKHDIVLGYEENKGFEMLSCEDTNLTFIWFPSVEKLLSNIQYIDPEVRHVAASFFYL
jgi:hypothetical protein